MAAKRQVKLTSFDRDLIREQAGLTEDDLRKLPAWAENTILGLCREKTRLQSTLASTVGLKPEPRWRRDARSLQKCGVDVITKDGVYFFEGASGAAVRARKEKDGPGEGWSQSLTVTAEGNTFQVSTGTQRLRLTPTVSNLIEIEGI